MILTPKMSQCLEFIRTYNAAHKRTPTYREIAKALEENSVSRAFRLVNALVARGYIKRTRCGPGMKRGARTLIFCFSEDAQPDWEGLVHAIIAEAQTMRETLKAHNLPVPPRSFNY